MLFTLSGITIEVRAEHLEKALSYIIFTLLPMVTEFKLTQDSKAELPIQVTLSGIMIEVKVEQPKKALLQISVTLLPIETEVKAEHL